MDSAKMASKIYEASLDMDYADYEDTKDVDISAIASALKKVKEYAKTDDDFLALDNALYLIFG